MEKKKKINIRVILVILFLLLLSVVTYINIRGNFLEYKELGEKYVSAFTTRQISKYIVLIVNFVFIYTVLYFTGRKIKKGLKTFFDQEKKQMPKLPNKSIALIVSAIESIIVANMYTSNIVLAISKVGFGERDPIFNLDISFFMFIEPVLKLIVLYFIGIFVAITLYSFGYYVIVLNKFFDGVDRQTLKKSPVMQSLYKNIKFIAVGFALYICICAMDVVYDNFLTTDNNIKLAGAGFVDSTVKYWGYNILAIIILISVFRAVKSMKNANQTKVLKDLAIIPIYLVALFIFMLLFDLIFVNPNEFDKEKIYIEKNISSTKKAYAIDCDMQNINYTGTVSVDEVKNNEEIINNTAIIPKENVLETLEESKKGTGYYTYKTAKILNYNIDGKNNLVYSSPREIVNNARTYNSKTYEYTHGYGLIFTSATEALKNGEIKYIQNDINGKEEKIKISRPQIYYGLETNTTVVTNAKNKKEFDYADSEKEYETNYAGNSGLSLKFLDRLILGIKEKNMNLAFASSVTSESKVLINRNIIKRAKLALPDVVYDESPYTVVDENGDIYWILDAYTVSSSYPYSTYTEIAYNGQKRGINYIRNSIKVIINSYTGEMKYYITDRTDPIAMAYRKIYPTIFEDLETQIPQSIQEKITYPEFLYNVQSTMLEEYHNTKADVLYRSDNTWEKATYKNGQLASKNGGILSPYYTMVKDSDGTETIGLIQMYAPKDKQSLTAYLVGTVKDGKNKLELKTLHSDTTILGPKQLDIQIAQDETIQSQINSLNVTGAKVTRNMVIVPVENTLIYIEPIYQTLVNESNLPVLKKVVVASGNKVAIGNDLTEAAQNLISQYATNIELENTEDINGLIQAIIKANNNLSDSLNGKNWELMGTDIRRLQDLVNSLEQQIKERKKESSKENSENTTLQNSIISNGNTTITE